MSTVTVNRKMLAVDDGFNVDNTSNIDNKDGTMITVDGSGFEPNNPEPVDKGNSGGNTKYSNSSDITSQLSVIKEFMKALDNSTKTDATEMLDEAIQACSSFGGINDAINHFLYDQSAYGSTFLSARCGIILDNTDTGAITGSDAGGSTAKTSSSVVLESGSLDTTFNADSFTYEGLTISLGTSDTSKKQNLTFDTLSDSQKIIWQALHSWWFSAALDLISESYGTNFGFGLASSATVKTMHVNFYTSSKDNVLASVSYGYDSNGRVIDSSSYPFSLNINMNYYGSITSATIDQDGKSSASGSLSLDRVLAHEFTHAVMAANISGFDKLPLFIAEGMAELTHGIDDARRSSINTLAGNSTALAAAVNMSTTKYTSDHAYAGGYMFLRYLAKQAYDATNIYVYGTEGNDNKKTKKTINNNVSNKIIMALAGNDSIVNDGDDVTIVGGAGNDSISGQGTRQTFQYANGDGKDLISNFSSTDTIHLTDATLSGASLKKNNVILKVGKGTLTLVGVKGQVVNIIDKDGNASSNIYGNGTVTMRGTDNAETITAWGKADSIYAMAGNDTLIGGKGADTLTGGDGYNVFYYNNGDGNDLITDYSADSDTIVIASGAISKAATVKNAPNDISFKVGKGSIHLTNGIGQKIKIIDAAGNTTKQQFGISSINVVNGDGATINAGVDALVETIDASARTEDLYLIGNSKANLIFTGTGNSTITTGKGKDTVDYIGGNLSINDYTSGSDAIRFNTDILSAKYTGDNLIFTTQLGTVSVSGAIKKNKAQKVTIIDKEGTTYSQIYGTPTLTVANSDGDTVSAESNTDVTVINAAKRSKPVYLIGNSNNNTIKGGKKNDTIEALSGDDYMTGGKGNDLFIYSSGNDTISDYSVGKNNMDAISLTGGLEIENYIVDGKML